MITSLAANTLLKRSVIRREPDQESVDATAADSSYRRTTTTISVVSADGQLESVGNTESYQSDVALESTALGRKITDALESVTALTDQLVSADDIEILFHHASYSTRFTGLSVAVSIVEKTTLLLKNGLAYVGLDAPPTSLSIPRETPIDGVEASGKWTTWRQNTSGNYELRNLFSGNWGAVQGEVVDTSPASFAELAGSYLRTQTKRYGSTSFSTQRGLNLSDDGRFVLTDSTLVTSGGLGGVTGPAPLNLSTHVDADSRESLFSSGYQPELNGETSNILQHLEERTEQADRFGTYRLLEDGATLELTNALGEVSTRLFIRLRGRVAMGGSSYLFHRSSNDCFDIDKLLEETSIEASAPEDWKDIVSRANRKRSSSSAASRSTPAVQNNITDAKSAG